jgi:Flp pilus assembly CpaE family ATPase
MGYSSDDVTLVLNRADSSVGISMSDVYTLLRKSPNVLVPSDRSIPRALTVGETIYESAPNSGAGRSFGALAQHYLGLSRVTEQRTYDDTLERRAEGSRRRRILRKGN